MTSVLSRHTDEDAKRLETRFKIGDVVDYQSPGHDGTIVSRSGIIASIYKDYNKHHMGTSYLIYCSQYGGDAEVVGETNSMTKSQISPKAMMHTFGDWFFEFPHMVKFYNEIVGVNVKWRELSDESKYKIFLRIKENKSEVKEFDRHYNNEKKLQDQIIDNYKLQKEFIRLGEKFAHLVPFCDSYDTYLSSKKAIVDVLHSNISIWDSKKKSIQIDIDRSQDHIQKIIDRLDIIEPKDEFDLNPYTPERI